MSLLGSALGPVISTVGGLLGGAMQAHSASKQAELEARLQRENWEYAQTHAHQFEVQDLRDAGLNPILSANHSQLASMPAVSIPSGPSAYGNLGTNLASAIQASMHNEIEKGQLEVKKKELEIRNEELQIQKNNSASQISLNEKAMDKMDNDIQIAWNHYKLDEKLASASIEEKRAGAFQLYSAGKKALAEADFTTAQKEKLDITMKYGSILAGYLPAEVRKMIGENLVTYCQGHSEQINECIGQLLEIATSKTSPSEKESDVKQTMYDFFGVSVKYDPSLLTDLIKVKRR